ITIYDEKTGDVVPGAKITVTSPSGKETKYTTNDDGQVTLKNIAAGEYKVTVTDVPEGYTVTENAEVSIQVVKNKTTKAQVRIDKDGEVSVSSKTTKSATKTGDTVPVVPIAAAFIIAVLGLVILMFKRRENA
ncbi:MAG: carboxypeptidase regulatory-like domain-containing protein, partial [Lachnospiraceae bacterium]|nr:carboxypeptidase regulatory-like domain-containing protein [Lachnospiraceae bacterium]